jgi:branched-chain amino acid aminotransferase
MKTEHAEEDTPMAQKIWLDGKLVDREDAKITVFDHGLLYGDGVFEGIRVYNGRVFELEAHIKRLYESAKAIRLDLSIDMAALTDAVRQTVSVNKITDGYVRLVATRGVGTLGLNPFVCKSSCIFIIADDIQLYPQELYETGIKVISAATVRNHPLSIPPQAKSLNYLNNILAKIDGKRAGVLESVMLNDSGRVAECTADNIFIIKNGDLLTPSLTEGALPGITRATVLELARDMGMKTHETALGLYDPYNADECFLTGTGAEIMPVTSVDGRQISTGKPGKTTMELLDRFRKLRVTDGYKVDYATEALPVG